MMGPRGGERIGRGAPDQEAGEEMLFPKSVMKIHTSLGNDTFRVQEGRHQVTVQIDNPPQGLKGTFIFRPLGLKTLRSKSGKEFVIRHGVVEKVMSGRSDTQQEHKAALVDAVAQTDALPDPQKISDWFGVAQEDIFGSPLPKQEPHIPTRHETKERKNLRLPDQVVGVVVEENGQRFIRIDVARGYRQGSRQDAGNLEVGTLVLMRDQGKGAYAVDRELGPADNVDVAIVALAYRAGLSPEFSEGTLRETSQIEQQVEREGEEAFIEREARRSHFEYEGGPKAREIQLVETYETYDHGQTRLDLRKNKEMKVCAIDPKETRDRDDLVSYEDLGNGVMRVGIHIADVDHYVYPGTALDRESSRRQSTAYLPGHIIPMLPEVLSAGVCSLDAKKSRLAQSIMITVYPDGRREVWHGATVVQSQHDFSYPEADRALTNTDHPFHQAFNEVKVFCDDIRAKRRERGALIFDDNEELKLVTDRKGVKRFVPYVRSKTSYMIEDLAIAASEAVGQLLIEGERGGESIVFERINEPPPLDRLMNQLVKVFYQRDLRAVAKTDGRVAANAQTAAYWLAYEQALRLPEGSEERQERLQALEEKRSAIVDHIQERIRAGVGNRDIGFMKKMREALLFMSPPAEYTLERGIGHAALATIPYVHFTSPIRRRPDHWVKRLRDAKLLHQPVTHENEVLIAELRAEAQRANEMAGRIAEAERDAFRVQALDMLRNVEPGTSYELKIAGYARRGQGVNVLMPLPGGGMHRFTVLWENLLGPSFDPKKANLSRIYRPGGTITLQFMGVDFINRDARFEFSGTIPTEPAPHPQRTPKKKPSRPAGSKPGRRKTRKPRK